MAQVRWFKQNPFFMTLSRMADMEEGITAREKLLYFVLSRYANGNGEAWPGYSTLSRKLCCTKATTVTAMNGLVEKGWVTKIRRHDGKAYKTNLYLLNSYPFENETETEEVAVSADSEGGGWYNNYTRGGIKNDPRGGIKNDPRGGIKIVPLTISSDKEYLKKSEREKEEQPPPPGEQHLIAGEEKKRYGEFDTVELNVTQYAELIKDYGPETVAEYIRRVDEHQASTGKIYDSAFATIKKWIRQDEYKNKPKPPPQNRFINFKQRKNDYAEIEKQEREHLDRKLANKGEVLASERYRRIFAKDSENINNQNQDHEIKKKE